MQVVMAKTLFRAIFQTLHSRICMNASRIPRAARIVKEKLPTSSLQRCSSQSIGFLWTPHLREPY